MGRKRQTIAVDFDGVIHSYTTPWTKAHEIHDPPVDGAIEWMWDTLNGLRQPSPSGGLADPSGGWDVVIVSTRARTWRGRLAMRSWLRSHAGNLWHEVMGARGIESVRVTATKVQALVYIDDRAVRFEGRFVPAAEWASQRPWNRRSP